jgi:DNA-binding HxlR family transcriptional regulator
MRASELAKMTCTIARSVDAIGDPWTIMIMKELFLGQRRFDDIQTYTGISPHLLSVRMKKLEKHGVVQRRAYQQRPTRYEYRLTEKGIDLWPILIAFKDWSAKWGTWPKGEPLAIFHKGCGHLTSLKTVCSHCDEPISARDVSQKMSPTMVRERALMAEKVSARKASTVSSEITSN